MTDIYTIKNFLNFLPYLKNETWYMLCIGIVIFSIYIAYLMVFERTYKNQHQPIVEVPKEDPSIQDIVDRIPLEDIHFFEQLSLVIRSHLEASEQVPSATKKTSRDFSDEIISEDIKEILSVCTYYEYTKNRASQTEKENIIQRLKMALR